MAGRVDAALFSAQIAHFQKELDDLKSRCRNADFRVGSSDDMKDLRKDSENFHAFTLEIKETTEVQHTLKGTARPKSQLHNLLTLALF